MRLEVRSVANFLVHLMGDKLTPNKQERFVRFLTQVLFQRFRDHWMPDKPDKGCGFRCLRIREDHLDPVLEEACHRAQISTKTVKKALPPNLMVWIDPFEVTYRIGDSGCIICIYSYQEDQVNVPWQAPPSLPAPAAPKWYCFCK